MRVILSATDVSVSTRIVDAFPRALQIADEGGARWPGDFRNAGPITWAVNLGAVAIRAGGKIVYDHEAMKITNRPEANRYFHREYRPGWEL